MEKDISSLRDIYLANRATYQNIESKAEILRVYFNYVNQIDLDFDKNNFIVMLEEAIKDDNNLEINIEEMYPEILKVLDVFFSATFIVKNFGKDRLLLGIY